MSNYKVVIDAGHGGTDSGAVSGDVKEKDLNLMIAKYMLQQFQNKGIDATLIRSTDETLSPTDRVNRILNAYGNNENVIVISNHINAAGSGIQGAEGAEVIYALRNNSNLATNILTSLGNAGQKVRKVFQRRLPSDTSKDYYFIHRNTGVTEPVIVEYGFIDNAEDLSRIQNNYKKYVDAVVNAVIATKEGKTIEEKDLEGTYTVKSGDSLWSIASKYNTTVSELKTLNNLTSNSLSIGQKLTVPVTTTANTYTVKSGDSLWKIASNYNTTVSAIKTLNNLTSNSLSIGQTLQIPEVESTENTYTVKSGDSLWSIANQYGTTVSELKTLNNLTTNSLSVGQKLNVPSSESGNTYTVKSGDSLWNIANKYNTTVNTLKTLNNLTTDTLSIGQTILLPTSNTYTVKSGDSLWSIANSNNTTVNTLKTLNNLTTNTLSVGQKLKLP